MKNLFKLVFIFLLIYLNASCSQKEKISGTAGSETPENMYILAMQDLD